MPTFAPATLAAWTGGQWNRPPGGALTGFTQDTRALRAGQVFVALKTEKRDGHDFLSAAIDSGASAAIVARLNSDVNLPQLVVADPLKAFQAIAREHRRAFRGAVIGVSGSCGKTSTKNLLARLLGGETSVLATEGNLNNFIGVPLTLTRLDPQAHESAVVEAGISWPGEMAELASMIQPDYGVITLVAPAHTQELGGLEGVAREKAMLLQHVRPGGLSVFPKQCWDFAPFQDLPQASIVVSLAGEKVTAPRATTYSLSDTALSTEIILGKRRFRLRRVTRGMAQNAALAIVLASELGMMDDAIQRALDGWQPAKWRGELVEEGGRWLYLDFYNANPASMADSLETFLSVAPTDKPRLLVIGCMEELGGEARRYHLELGRSLRLGAADRALVIGTEAEAVRAGALEAGQAAERIEVVTAVESIKERLQQFQGAVFMKGSRRYQLEKALPPMVASTSGGGGGAAAGAGPARSSMSAWSGLPVKQVAVARSARTSTHPFL